MQLTVLLKRSLVQFNKEMLWPPSCFGEFFFQIAKWHGHMNYAETVASLFLLKLKVVQLM